jgi:hypothetical protein
VYVPETLTDSRLHLPQYIVAGAFYAPFCKGALRCSHFFHPIFNSLNEKIKKIKDHIKNINKIA